MKYRIREISGDITWLYGFEKRKNSIATGKWKSDIKRLSKDFRVDSEPIIKSIEDEKKGDESDNVLYERARRKIMAIAFS